MIFVDRILIAKTTNNIITNLVKSILQIKKKITKKMFDF